MRFGATGEQGNYGSRRVGAERVDMSAEANGLRKAHEVATSDRL